MSTPSSPAGKLCPILKGFKSLAESTDDRNIIVWVNEYFGRLERDGKDFGEMTVYRKASRRSWVDRDPQAESGHVRP